MHGGRFVATPHTGDALMSAGLRRTGGFHSSISISALCLCSGGRVVSSLRRGGLSPEDKRETLLETSNETLLLTRASRGVTSNLIFV